jgi:hypothetical protein
MPIMMLVVCRKRELDTLVDEYGDWQPEGVQVKLYGITTKAHDGFILLEWSKPIPERFLSALGKDEDILDSLTYDASFPPGAV